MHEPISTIVLMAQNRNGVLTLRYHFFHEKLDLKRNYLISFGDTSSSFITK
jgi:hypothetical protein